jgi:hypothetical protein
LLVRGVPAYERRRAGTDHADGGAVGDAEVKEHRLSRTTHRLSEQVLEAVAGGDREGAARRLGELVRHSYLEGMRSVTAGVGEGGDAAEDDVGVPVADFDAWIASDLAGTNRGDLDEVGRLAAILRTRLARVALRRTGDGVEISVFLCPPPAVLPDGSEAPTVGPLCPPQVIDAHYGIWESARRAAGYRRRLHSWWGDEEILEAIRTWTELHGRAPNTRDWANATEDHPTAAVVTRRFMAWKLGLMAAGVTPPKNCNLRRQIARHSASPCG